MTSDAFGTETIQYKNIVTAPRSTRQLDSPSHKDLEELTILLRNWKLETREPRISVLGGGVSNLVVKVETDKGVWVVKQALAQLRVKDTWLADRSRILREAACLECIEKYVGEGAAPRVVLVDAENYACVLEYGEGGRSWKEDLMGGIVDPKITQVTAGMLSRLHVNTRGDRELTETFRDHTNFVQLRIDPYFTTLSQRHSDIKAIIDGIVEPLLSDRLCVVHGDYSPKNILLLPDGRTWILDCEAAYYGNPAFDVAFCTNHLILKSIHFKSTRHLVEASNFWSSYWNKAHELYQDQERLAVRTLAALMLARVDGKSPAEYLTEDEKVQIRRIARTLLLEDVDDFATIYSRISDLIGREELE